MRLFCLALLGLLGLLSLPEMLKYFGLSRLLILIDLSMLLTF